MLCLCPSNSMMCRSGFLGQPLILRSLHYLRLSLSNSTAAAGDPQSDQYSHRDTTPFVIFDTAKASKCRLTTRRQNVLTWYSCGPTVYDSAHIGHASSFIRQDVIRRIMEANKSDITVIQVMGITDIDDKIIKKASDTGVEWHSVSKHFEREFMEDLTSLKVLPPHAFTRVSDYIPQILQFVDKLVKTGYAYEVTDGSVYFDTEKYGAKYGLFRQATNPADDTSPASSSDGKKSDRDFALWKGAKPGEPFWTSPWGKGRPGWHIECSVMASQFFGESLDLHTGGRDLIFPHHENEEAQCCAHFQSSQWSAHWIHMGHLHFKGDVKMSKSLGNTVSIRNFLQEHSPDVLRVMCIMAKYRKNLEYSPDSVDIAQKILRKLHSFLSDTTAVLNGTKPLKLANPSHGEVNLWEKLELAKENLNSALLDDFDTPTALKIVTELISDFNRHYVPSYSSSAGNSNVNLELVLTVKIFVQDFLNLVGLSSSPLASSSGSSISNSTPSSSSTSHDSRLESVLDQFVQFRNQVRSYSLAMEESDKELRKRKIADRKELLQACDTVRNEMLTGTGVEIKDHGKTSSWSFAPKGSQSGNTNK